MVTPSTIALDHADHVLLAEALVAASFAYGDDQWTRSDVVKAFLRTLPEMRDLDLQAIYRLAERNVRRHGAIARIHELHRIRPEAMRRRCLVLAMDVAFSSGILDDGETLDAIKTSLGISDADARQYASVLRMKYPDTSRHGEVSRRAGRRSRLVPLSTEGTGRSPPLRT